MIKLIIPLLIALSVNLSAYKLVADDKAAHILGGAYLTSLFKDWGIDPWLSLGLITAFSVWKESRDDKFDLADINYTIVLFNMINRQK